MNISKRNKIMLLVVFGIGIFSVVASITRLHTIKVWTHSKNPFYDSVPVNLWSMIEVNVSIVCASMPAMRPVFRPVIWREFRSRGTYPGKTDQPQSPGYEMDQFRPPPPNLRGRIRDSLDHLAIISGHPLDAHIHLASTHEDEETAIDTHSTHSTHA
ncbi:hypothetical protein AJ80_08190 [Polytolypa hystricis UAMH7299]|uniref:Rhodopsin domain-containing protein n=1 Tax=Polytolypa hystricis (strain UAMH7299) TaxID=1447883 RepID=A0A2B7XB89_POLH7|nr:hypothetical protein AJ80_08190 [Polytolypa hystricis UAMH7299]